MNKEFIDALNVLAAERNLDRDQLLGSIEESIQTTFQKNVEPGKDVEVSIDPDTGEMDVVIVKSVVEVVENENTQISIEDALELDSGVEVGMEMEFPVDVAKFTRIAVQAARQTITQRIRKAERATVYEEYKDRVGDIITGVVSRTDTRRSVFVDLGRGEAILPVKEQLHGERYVIGMRLKVHVDRVETSDRGPTITVSRAAPELLEHLMRQEIPEVAEGTVEIKAIAREAGQRSKVAVTSNSPNVDPIGACIGHRGSRIQAVTADLMRERVDIIPWDPNPREFINNALSPANVGLVEIDTDTNTAKVTVQPDQLSLAIGKSGQNVRLAAKLTGYKIDLVTAESIEDLDAAIAAAASKESEPRKEPSHAVFDSIFIKSKDGATASEEGTKQDSKASSKASTKKPIDRAAELFGDHIEPASKETEEA